MPTADQIKDAERLQRYIEREQLVSVMNNTKWSELRALMIDEASFSPRYRVKCLRTTDERPYYWGADWYHHLPTFKAIEWLEIDPVDRERKGHLVPDIVTDKRDELEQLLGSRSIPFEWEGEFIRVYGYRRPAA